MSYSQQQHNEEHDEWIRLLVEGELDGRRKRVAERRLLSCPKCLEEYNAYQKFWTLVTGPAFHRRQTEHLKRSAAEADLQCAEAIEKLAAAPAPVSSRQTWNFGRALALLRQPALSAALLLIVLLALPYLAYRSIRLERQQAARLEASRMENQRQLEKAQEELRKPYESRLAALSQKMAELSQPDTAAFHVIIPKMQRGPDAEYPPVPLTGATKFLVLTINLESDYARHTIEIADTARENLWHKSGVATQTGSLSLVIPTEFFKKDRYIVSVYGESAGEKKKLISEFSLRIRGGR